MGLEINYSYDDYENITLVDNDKEYKFIIKKQEALIEADDFNNIQEYVKTIKNLRPHVYKFYSKDHSFYQEFDMVYSFKLPIKIIQPSKVFIDKDIVEKIGDNIDDENAYFPVNIIDNEYVLLDGHARLYCINENYVKMVNVYISDYKNHVPELAYVCREGNITKISDVNVLKHEEYEMYWNNFKETFNIEE